MKVRLDFETRSEVDIKKTGAWVYASHPSTEINCMSYAIGDGEIQVIFLDHLISLKTRYEEPTIAENKLGEWTQIPTDLAKALKEKAIFEAHYSMFEYYIWHEILVKRFGFPNIPKRQWRCTAAKVAVLALPRSLDKAAEALDIEVRKDMEGKRLMLKMCKPRKSTKEEKERDKLLGEHPVRWHETPEQFERLGEYCKIDVDVERAIDKAVPDLSSYEQEVWFLDQEINRRGIKVDIEAVDAALDLIKQYKEEKIAEVIKLSGGFLDGVSRTQRVLTWIKGEGVYLPDFTKETVNEALSKELPSKVKRVLEIRRELGRTSTAKYTAFKNATDKYRFVCDTLIYHGASTGRWTGKNIQLHNLPRGTIEDIEACIDLMKTKDLAMFRMFYPKVMEAISSCIRGVLIAREGYEFYVGDFNAVEVRVLFWLAGEYAGLKRYELNQDLYVDMAQRIFDSTEINSLKRFVGKQTVLGCGFGMGLNGKRFVKTCRQHNVSIALETAQRAVRVYRSTYRAIPSYWKNTERAAIEAVLTRKPIRLGKVIWFVKGDFLYVKLPSGRCLAYHKPEIHEMSLTHMGINSETKAYERQTTWGGILVENVVQATARDIMVAGMFNVEEKDYKVLLTVHDEVMSERNVKSGTLKEYNKLLSNVPSWAKDCPIKVESWIGRRYKKV